ncbi:carbohydrate kinase family protein [candidate division KSB1 bacterium]|nr:carbohydrate kinase family protein [candidate division KSB1 bacterium]
MDNLDVIVIGELNADLILQDIPSFPEMGKEKIAKNMTLTMGSASALMASNVAQLGLKTGFIGKIGDDLFGRLVTDTLQDLNVDIDGIMVDGSVQTGVTVVMSYPRDNAMLTFMGGMEDFSVRNVDPDYLGRARHMHLSSYYLQPGMREGCNELFKMAKEMGLTTSFYPGWDPSENWEDDIFEVLPYVDILFCTKKEGQCISKQKSVEDVLNKLNEVVSTVLITSGSEGAICCQSDGNIVKVNAYPIVPIDTTGAKESFHAGFLLKWLEQADLETCMRYGSACGAIACTRIGGGSDSYFDLNELEHFLKTNPKDIISH